MRTRCLAVGLLIITLTVLSARADEPLAKPPKPTIPKPTATEPSLAQHPLERPVAKTWRTHRDAGHLPLLDPAHWQILGCQNFSPDDIRNEVARDEDVLLATHPAAPADDLEKLPALLAEKVLDGYRTTGFPQAKVQARREGELIKIEIVEGRRLTAGPIEIIGAKTLDVKQLLARLSEPYIPENANPTAFEQNRDGKTRILWLKGNWLQRPKDPAWEIGKPAQLAPADYMRSDVEKACANQGRPEAKFELEIKTEPGSNTARLRVCITDEGPLTVIKQIRVSGCKKNTPQQVIDYLQVQPGTAWTRERELLAKQRLWQAARFRRYELKLERQPGSGDATLAVKVAESELAPALSQPFTPMEQACLKFRQWIGAFCDSDDELLGTRTDRDQQIEVIFSPRLGSIFTWRLADAAGKPAPASFLLPHWLQTPLAPTHTAVISTDALALYSHATGRRLVARPLPGNLLMIGTIKLVPGDDGEYGSAIVSIGAHTWASAPPGAPALRSLIVAQPVAFIYTARKYAKTSSLTDGILTIGIPDDDDTKSKGQKVGWCGTQVRVSAATGRLLELTYDSADEHTHLTLGKGVYRSRSASLEATFGRKPNDFDPREPLGSTLAFVTREMDESRLLPELGDDERGALRVARKALAAHILEPLDQSLVRLNSAMHDPNIPFCLGSKPKHQHDRDNTNAEMAYCVWLYSDDWAARGTWLWDLARDAIMAGVGLDQYTPMEISQQLTRSSNGPLANLAAAAALKEAGANVAALRFARRGRRALDAAKFRADITALLDDRGLAGRSLRRAAEVVRQFNDEDITWLTNEEADDVQLFAHTLCRELAKDPQQPIAKALPDVLDRLWDSHLKQYLAAGLQAYLDTPPKPSVPPAEPLQPPTSTKPQQP
jgi:hypothetical protein